MSTTKLFVIRNRMLPTILAAMGWLVLMLYWIAFAWGQYSFFQTLVGLGIATLLYAAVTGVLWVGDQGFTLVATIVATLGGLNFALYWIAFAWSQHTLLLNGAVLLLSFLAWLGAVTWLWLVGPSDQAC